MSTAHGTEASFNGKLDQILERLKGLEEKLLLYRLERLDEAEEFEGDPSDASPEVSVLQGAGGMAGVVSFASVSMVAPFLEKRFEEFIDKLGFNFFRGNEFTPYWSRIRNGVKNSLPPESLWPNIVRTIVVLEKLRGELGSSIHITSTYRSTAYNAAIKGAKNSQHIHFRAIDFVCSTETPDSWAARLKGYRGNTFRDPHTGDDFVFRGGIGIYSRSGFVHVDTRGYDADW